MKLGSAYKSKQRRFVPTLESLDQRAMPSATIEPVSVDGDILRICGDSRANSILITDNGNWIDKTPDDPSDDQIFTAVVVLDGKTFNITEVFTGINVVTGGGADDVIYNLTGDLSNTRIVDVSLGNGHDSFDANLHGKLVEDGSLFIFAKGGNGKDHLSINANMDIGADASLIAVLEGGNGKDELSIDYSGLLQGWALLSANGGNGKDLVSGNIELSSQTDGISGQVTTSNGSLTLDFQGGNGVDQMDLSVEGKDNLSSFTFQFDGGRGHDIFLGNMEPSDPPKTRK